MTHWSFPLLIKCRVLRGSEKATILVHSTDTLALYVRTSVVVGVADEEVAAVVVVVVVVVPPLPHAHVSMGSLLLLPLLLLLLLLAGGNSREVRTLARSTTN